MKHRNLGKFLVIAASVSMALSPVSALANEAHVLNADEASASTVDKKSLLNSAIAYANKAKQADSYTHVVPKVKAYLESKLTNATTVSGNANATDTEIKNAWSELVDAVHYLDFTGDITDLTTLVNQHKDKEEEDYKAGWEAFNTALKAAQAALADENTLDAELDEKEAALRAAVAGLKAKDPVTTDRTELQAAIDSVKNLNSEDYTTDSWAALEVALTAANAVNEDPAATQDQVNTAKDALLQAIKDLKEAQSGETVDKSALDAALDAAKTPVETDYTPESWSAFADAKAEAQKVYDKTDATADEVKKATDDLTAAQNALVKKDEPAPEVVDKAALKAALDAAAVKKEADYTPESWSVFAAAKAAAQDVYEDTEATKDEVLKATNDLIVAQNALVDKEPDPVVIDKSALKEAITTAEALNEEDYTPDSWADLKAALSTAKTVNEDPDATQDQVNTAKADLLKAIDELQKAQSGETVDKSALKAALDTAAGKKEADYTPESWKTFADAKDAAQNIYDKTDATKDDVLKATQELTAATNALKPKAEETKVDKSELVQTLKANEKLNAKAPTGDETLSEDTYKAFKDAYAKADAVNKNEKATQKEVDDATKALKAAYANLDQTIWRVYNPNNGEHLFTANKEEYDALVKLTWHGEGKAWIAPRLGDEKAENMIRMYNKNSGEHHYTATANEIKHLESIGWANEGKKWAAYTDGKAAEGIVAVHRMYNPNAGKDPKTMAGPHHYTLDTHEKDELVKIGWNWEHNPEDIFYAKAKAEK